MSAQNKLSIRETLDDIEKRIDQCRILYELYFSGIEKREPTWHRQEVLRLLTRLQRENISNSVDRFKLRGIRARFNTLTQYWNRVNLQRENGTYFKDKQRARRRLGSVQQPNAAGPTAGVPDDASDTDEHPTVFSIQDPDAGADGVSEDALNRAAIAAAAAAAASEKSSRDNGGRLTEERCQKIYRTYLAAKKRCGESANVDYDSMVKSMRKQVPRLQERGYKDIDFKVVIKDGKAALKPVGKKG
jgi:hypothetical protein